VKTVTNDPIYFFPTNELLREQNSLSYRRPRRAVTFFALRAAPRALLTAFRATFFAVAFAFRPEARTLRAGFDRRAFVAVLLLFRTSFVAERFTSFTAVSVPPTIASFAASAFAAIAPSVDPIDSATLTRRSCDFAFEVAKAGLLQSKLRSYAPQSTQKKSESRAAADSSSRLP
jgi:hypothetical protein